MGGGLFWSICSQNSLLRLILIVNHVGYPETHCKYAKNKLVVQVKLLIATHCFG